MSSSPAAPAPSTPAAPGGVPHSLTEDAVAIFTGVLLMSVGVAFFTSAGLLTGGTAGLAFLLHYATGIGFGKIFFVLNLPFYWLGYKRMGGVFVAKTFAAVAILSVASALLPEYVSFATLHPAVGAILFGFISGAGLLALFRHGASLGGVGIVALYLQDKTGFKAGWTQLLFDLAVFALALTLRDPVTVAWSFLGALILNMVIMMNHRRDRYIAT